MKKVFLVYGVAYSILLMSMLGLQYVYPKLELHLLLNSYHTRLQDVFFTYYSMLAEGPLYALALIPVFWKKVRMILFFGLCELSGGAVLQILKHLISMPRPSSVFENYPDITLPVVEGVSLHSGNSFPSGHASTFFIFCTCCALYLAYRYKREVVHNRSKKILFGFSLLILLALAALGAYSRVYLSQHFLSDVCMGSVIGFVTPCLMFYFGRKKILKLKSNI
jgi:membrane-associated phospholipid phosphatase